MVTFYSSQQPLLSIIQKFYVCMRCKKNLQWKISLYIKYKKLF